MSRDLLIAVGPGEARLALVEDGSAVAYRIARLGEGGRLGEIYLGRVTRLLPALPAALVDIGADRPAFLSAEDAVDTAPPEKRAAGIASWLTEGQAILVQITREAQGEKAVGVSLRLRLAGRHLSLTPARARLVLPRGGDSEARARLEAVLAAALRPGEGVVASASALTAAPEALQADLAALRSRWAALQERARVARAPELIAAAEEPVLRLLAAALDPPPQRIVIDDRAAFAAARQFLARHRPELVPCLAVEAEEGNLFERHGIAGDLETATSRRVALPGGGALIIEATAAMSVIDVDGGTAVAGRRDAARAALAVNLAAARAAARQIRLRGLAGAIAIDFVSMRWRGDRDRVSEALAAALADDPAEPQLLGWTRLGHVELTRKRREQPLAEILFEPQGAPMKTALTVALEALRLAAREASRQPGKRPSLVVSPDVAAALAGGAAAAALRGLEARLGGAVVVRADPALPREAFDISLD